MRFARVFAGWRIWILAPLFLLLASTCSKKQNKTDVPEVTIIAPGDGSPVEDTVTIEVDVTDADGVARVEFYIDSVLRYTDNTSPYTYAWDCTFLPDGSTHTIQVKAIDVASNDSTTAPIIVSAHNARLYPRGLGFMPLPDNQYFPFPVMPTPGIGSLPASVDLSASMPPVGDQGMQASGVGWAVGYALKSYQEKIEHKNWTFSTVANKMSPAYIYNQIHTAPGTIASVTSGPCDENSTIESALNLLREKGCASLATMPYDPAECLLQPSAGANTEALKYRIMNWSRVDFTNADAVKRHLAGGFPVLIGFHVYENFFYLPADSAYSHAAGALVGDQAACIVGYNEGRHAFKIINSWGTGWSDHGYGWIAYSFLPDVCHEAYAVVDSIEGNGGKICVTTNHFQATFSIAKSGGGASYQGGGTSWSVSDAPAGSYTITYGQVSGFSTPAAETRTLATGGLLSFSLGKYTCTNSSPLPASTRIAPAATDQCVGGSDTLVWSAVIDPSCGGTVTYDVYFGTANPPPLADTGIANTWYPVGGMTANTKYYWKVVVNGSRDRQTSSPLWDFTTGCVSALGAAANPHPLNNATCMGTTDTLTWNTVSDPCGGAVTYDLYFGTVNPPPKLDSNLTSASYIRSGLTRDIPYYWRVDTRGSCGRRTVGTVWKFTPACKTAMATPAGPTPATGATGQPASLTLIWGQLTDPCGGSVSYDVYFGTTEPLPRVAPGLTQNSYLVSSLLPGRNYKWRVCVKAPCRDSVFGPTWEFTTSCTTPLPSPAAPVPADAALCNALTDTLTWSAVTDPCGDPVKYDVYFGTTNPIPLVASDLSTTAYPVTGLAVNTKYYWKVCAKSSSERQSCPSSEWSFTTLCTSTLSSASIPVPTDGATSQPSTLTIGWNAITDPCGGEITYDVYVDTVSPPRLVASGVASNTYLLSGLSDGLKYWKVRVNGVCDRHAESPVWSFRVGCVGALPTPAGPDPETGATGQPSSLTLHWGAVVDPCGDTVKYDVYFGLPTNPPLVTANLRNNWYSVSGLSASSKYYWKVIAKGTKSRQTIGPVWNFTTVCPELAEPTGPNPIDGATCNVLVDTLTWTAVTDPCGPVTYDVYFGDPLILRTTGLTVNRYIPTGLSANTKYNWKVCANGTDDRQTCSPVWSLTTGCPRPLPAPTVVAPLNNATGRPTTDTLSWSAIPDSCGNAVTYEVYFDTVASPKLVEATWNTTRYPLSGLVPYKKYYWKICARGTGGCKTCGATVWNFTTGCPPLTAPSAPNPADGATSQPVNLNLQWVSSLDSCGAQITYDVYFDTLTPPGMVAAGMVSNFYSVIGLHTNKSYYWKVVAHGTDGRTTSSPIWDFTTTCPDLLPAPATPIPADSSGCQAKPDTIRWNAVVDPCGDAVTYDVYFGKTNPPAKIDSGLTVSKYHPSGLNDTTVYYWKICAKGSRSRQTCSGVWRFTTKCPKSLAVPSDPAPADSADDRPAIDTLRWDPVVDSCGKPVTYDVYFGDADPPVLVSANQSASSYPVSMTTTTKYYWKVCAKGSGACMSCSDVWVFNTACAALPAPGTPSPADGALCQSRKPTFTWGTVIDSCLSPVTYDVYLDTLNPPVAKIDSNLNVNTITSDSLEANRTYYWKVCANGTGGRKTCGAVWSFNTGCPTTLPAPVNPIPGNDSLCNPLLDTLRWDAVTDPCGDSVHYDVHFGTTNPPPKVDSNRITTSYTKSGLVNNTKYYWKIVAKSTGGCQTSSAVWSFSHRYLRRSGVVRCALGYRHFGCRQRARLGHELLSTLQPGTRPDSLLAGARQSIVRADDLLAQMELHDHLYHIDSRSCQSHAGRCRQRPVKNGDGQLGSGDGTVR
ncbi:MAG: hypothetical protein HZB43_07155 [candidate division Zixibacteria bacterium]|nr:hypothetical protein [candidate division Zixibacteria bacterium]